MADMDIDMDIDIGLTEDDMAVQYVEAEINPQDVNSNSLASNGGPDVDTLSLIPEKVHLRGLDNLTTNDIEAFAAKWYSAQEPERIEWIDDTSANLIYSSPGIAAEALISFADVEISDVSKIPAQETVPAKSFPSHPDTHLQVRLAVVGDRKQAGARDRSRFYLLNPEFDPAERMKRGRGGNRYRDRDDGGYRSQRYDDREHRRRQDGDEQAGFDASLYDDDAAAIAHRATRRTSRRESTSSRSRSRERTRRQARFRGAAGKELFPESGSNSSGRLRDRSASPMRDVERPEAFRRRDNAASANRASAQVIKAQLQEASAAKELFPSKIGRSGILDPADSTADLFSKRMYVPFTDGSSDQPSRNTPLGSRITSRADDGRLKIRGAASPQEFSVKGAAAVKELFPSLDNSGKELFGVEGRGRRRQKAEDLFL